MAYLQTMSNSIPKSSDRQLGRLSIEPLLWRIAAAMICCAPIALPASAQTTPVALPKDWCGRLWGIDTAGRIVWDNPTTGVTKNRLASASGILNIGPVPAPGVTSASLGLHARSGTLYTMDINSSSLYYYHLTSTGGGSWSSISTVIPPVSGATNSQQQSSTFNKMTVTGNNLIIASADSLNVYTLAIDPATGVPSSTSSLSNPTFDGNTLLPDGSFGDPPGSTSISGGDIAQDEYGDTYMLTYDNAGAAITPQYVYFYKLVGNQWIYKDRATKVGSANEQFGGFAIYNDTFYVKGSVGQLYKLNLTRVGNDYNWATNNSALSPVGSTGTGVGDMATCGVPAIGVTKTQQIYVDESAQTLAADQTRIGTGQYIKYTITGINAGDAWARNSYIKDDLPPGITYVPNSATENGVNLNAATYPFGSSANKPATSSGALVGEIRLPFLGNSNVTTYTFIVRVDGTAASVSNQATIGYLNPSPSDSPNCTTGLNCANSALVSIFPSIFGTIWNDTNGSAAGTFSNIFTTGEVGTNTGTANALYALLVNSTNNKVIRSQPVASDGKYAFQALNSNQNNLIIQLNTASVSAGATVPVATIPIGWKATSPKITAPFDLTTLDLFDRDFGIALPAGVILVKRITAINGQTTNDGKDLTAVVDPTTTTTTNDDASRKWPSGYLKGAVDAGKVQPGDTIEYTIYYLNDGNADAKNLRICDPIRGNQTYLADSIQMLPGGVPDLPANRLQLTDLVDLTVDRANSYAAGIANLPTGCNVNASTVLGTDNGGVAIQITGSGSTNQPDLLAIPGAKSAGLPTGSYGWFRFTTKVDP